MALQKLMRDPDVKVRRQAWHTLEDGGPTPEAKQVADEICDSETDPRVRSVIRQFFGFVASHSLQPTPRSFKHRGKCDFCGRSDIAVADRYDIDIPDGSGTRAAKICDACVSSRHVR